MNYRQRTSELISKTFFCPDLKVINVVQFKYGKEGGLKALSISQKRSGFNATVKVYQKLLPIQEEKAAQTTGI